MPGRDADVNGDSFAHADSDTYRFTHCHSEPNADRNANTDANCGAIPDPHIDSDLHTHFDGQPNRNAIAHADGNPDDNINANPNRLGDANHDGHGDVNSDACPYAYDTDSDPHGTRRHARQRGPELCGRCLCRGR